MKRLSHLPNPRVPSVLIVTLDEVYAQDIKLLLKKLGFMDENIHILTSDFITYNPSLVFNRVFIDHNLGNVGGGYFCSNILKISTFQCVGIARNDIPQMYCVKGFTTLENGDEVDTLGHLKNALGVCTFGHH